jgi:hypothetical protein
MHEGLFVVCYLMIACSILSSFDLKALCLACNPVTSSSSKRQKSKNQKSKIISKISAQTQRNTQADLAASIFPEGKGNT